MFVCFVLEPVRRYAVGRRLYAQSDCRLEACVGAVCVDGTGQKEKSPLSKRALFLCCFSKKATFLQT